MPFKIMCVAGARPNFMKIGPIMKALKKDPTLFEPILVHTGQHYDYKMSQIFFDELQIDPPDIFLNVGSGSHAEQTAKIMTSFEEVVLEQQPDLVLVVGDVNSTAACAMVAKKCHILLAHVEAGLRSFDRKMPEEINRLVTDSISDFLYTTSRDADVQLEKEGHPDSEIVFVGNCMIDTLLALQPQVDQSTIKEKLQVQSGKYALMTLHRPSNVDDPQVLGDILEALSFLDEHMPIVCPLHPRTRKNIKEFGFQDRFESMHQFMEIEPLGYLDFVNLMKNAALVITDSGGLQEESTVLGIPCLTLRENTERPITITEGTNYLVGVEKGNIIDSIKTVLEGKAKKGDIPEYWDGKAAVRIAKHLKGIIAEG